MTAICAEEAGLGWFDLETRRKEVALRYAWAVPNDEALDAVAGCGPIVEVRSGSGYWASRLNARGVDVAYDREPPGSNPEAPERYGDAHAYYPTRLVFFDLLEEWHRCTHALFERSWPPGGHERSKS